MQFKDVKVGQFFDVRNHGTFRKVSEKCPSNMPGARATDFALGKAKQCSTVTGKPGRRLVGFHSSFRVSNVR